MADFICRPNSTPPHDAYYAVIGHTHAGGSSMLVVPFTDTITLTNSPLAVREILGQTSWRLKLDLGAFTQYRIVMNVQTAGAVNADVALQGSTDGTNFGALDGSAGPEIAIGTTGAKDSGWVTLAAAYRGANIFIRMREKDGDGVLDPILRQVLIMFK